MGNSNDHFKDIPQIKVVTDMKYRKLSELAQVQSGLVLSRKVAKSDTACPIEYRNLNLRSIQDDGNINSQLLDQYFASEKLEKQFITGINDIVVRLFPPFRPVLIKEMLTGLVVPSQFAIIRLHSDELLAEFLCCYLTHRNIMDVLAIRESGLVSSGIKISALLELNIPLPSIEKQRTTAVCWELNIRRKQLYLDLVRQYDYKLDVVINNVIRGEKYGYDEEKY